MIPFEALMPYGVILVMFCVAGGGMALGNSIAERGHRRHVHLDPFDKLMRERDLRLTGLHREQLQKAIAHPEFGVSSTYKLTKSLST
ncbi:putative NIMM subunit of mitochondrial NADH:ubiquinone oxidoreductase [Lipomyces oligophaga]|uniref:putative NIMM subunit of mitochondrial NADH:ubiquinone oxidoreductase n=1 Tax=Lipomyces oligophaga TaxID=45792 RepID=UPI0034CFF1FF